MATVTMLGLPDHGRPVSTAEFESADFEPGFKYEIIRGKLYVTYEQVFPEDFLGNWLGGKLNLYGMSRSDIINYVTTKARVFVPRHKATIPEPDIAAFSGLRVGRDLSRLDWRRVSPFIVAEVMYRADPFKDLVRNVELYLEVPSIREYWILDARDGPNDPTLMVFRRPGSRCLPKMATPSRSTSPPPCPPGFKSVLAPPR